MYMYKDHKFKGQGCTNTFGNVHFCILKQKIEETNKYISLQRPAHFSVYSILRSECWCYHVAHDLWIYILSSWTAQPLKKLKPTMLGTAFCLIVSVQNDFLCGYLTIWAIIYLWELHTMSHQWMMNAVYTHIYHSYFVKPSLFVVLTDHCCIVWLDSFLARTRFAKNCLSGA